MTDIYLASYANPDPHDLKFVNENESFELLVKRVFDKGNCPVELVELGQTIARKSLIPINTYLVQIMNQTH